MRFFIPSFNGDVRFEPREGGGCTLVTADLTHLERQVIAKWAKDALKCAWITPEQAAALAEPALTALKLDLDAPLGDAAYAMARLLSFKAQGVLTAFSFANGEIKATELVEPSKLPRWARKALALEAKKQEQKANPIEVKADPSPYDPPKPEPEPVAAVTVKRPSLSCPECLGKPERDRMACDVLWEFLSPEQRKEWKKDRSVTAFGGLTGHAYRLHPRDSPKAAAYGRVAFDLDDRVILHNFTRDVPPEEELLGVKLILEHREDWLRVHGEVDPIQRASPGTVFDNPFAGRAIMGW